MSKRGMRPGTVALLAAAVLVVALAGWAAFGHTPDLPPANTSSPAASSSPGGGKIGPFRRLAIYGHSMPAGGGASSPDKGYATLLAKALDLRLVNRAHGGYTAKQEAEVMASRPPRPGDLVVLHVGMNDILLSGDHAVDQGQPAVDTMLSDATRGSLTVVVLECRPQTWQHAAPYDKGSGRVYDAWNTMLKDEAARWKHTVTVDACEKWNPDQDTDATRYHPNDAGHRLIAQAVESAVESANASRS